MQKEDLNKYILAIVSPFLTQPDQASCSFSVDDMGTLFILKIDKNDFGRVIGRNGETIKNIRYLIRAAGLTHGIRASIRLPDE